MRVCLVAPELMPVPPVRGGAIETGIAGVAPELARLGVDVHVISVSDPTLKPKTEHVGQGSVTYHYIDIPPALRRVPLEVLARGYHYFREAGALINRLKPDLVRHHNRPVGLLVARARYRHPCRHVLSLHNLDYGWYFSARRVERWWVASGVGRCDRVFAVSHFLRAYAQRRLPGLDPARLHTLHNGVDTALFHPAPSATNGGRSDDGSTGFNSSANLRGSTNVRSARGGVQPNGAASHRAEFGISDNPLILFAGRIDPRKGVDVLLKAFQLVKQRVPSAQLVIVGPKGSYWHRRAPDYAQQIEQAVHRMPDVRLLEPIYDRQRLARLYACADVACLPYQSEEGFGLTTVELQACGVPVVTTAIGAVPETVRDGLTGFLVKPHDVQSLADRLVRLLEDDALRAGMRQAARTFTEREFSWSVVAQRSLRHYEELVASPASTSVSRTTKVLYLVDKGGVGGVSTHLWNLLQRLDRSRFAPSACFLLNGGVQEERLRTVSVPVQNLGLRKIYGWRAIVAFVQLVRWMRRQRFDVVHTYLFSANLFGVLAAWVARVPVIISSRREIVDWMRWRHRLACRLINRLCHVITVNSEAIARSVIACERADARKLMTIYNGVDAQRFRPLQEDAGQLKEAMGLNGGPLILTVGRLSPSKGHADLLTAAPHVVCAYPDATFLLAGDGPMRGSLITQAARLDIAKHVRFLGKQQDIPALLAVADLVVVPSRTEGFSNALLEAMASGRAIIATTVGGNPEAIRHGENGWLVSPGDPPQLAQAVLMLLNDSHLRGRLGHQARHTAESQFPIRRMVDEIQTLYTRLLRQSKIQNPKSKIALGPSVAIGAILSQFPRYDEAFILRELTALAQAQDVAVFSLKPCRDRVVHEQAKALVPKTVYAPFAWSQALWRSHAFFLRRSRRAYLWALWWIVSRHWMHPVVLAKTLVLFPKTVHFARLAMERGVTHLHAFWATYPATVAAIISRLTGIPYSVSGHAHDLYTTNPALREKLRAAQFVVTCTEANRQYLLSLLNGTWDMGHGTDVPLQRGGKREARSWKLEDVPASSLQPPASPSVFVNYHGVDLSTFAPAPKPNGPVCRILAVGSLLPCKGFETLIEACAILQSRGGVFHCTIAGGGPLEPRLRRLIARRGLTRGIELTGVISQARVAELYRRAHLLVLPLLSRIHWGIPNVLIEALATKTPVICCELPSMRELVEHGISGWLIPERDPHALAEAIATLWADEALRNRLAEAGYARVAERFSLEHTGAAFRNLFVRSVESVTSVTSVESVEAGRRP